MFNLDYLRTRTETRRPGTGGLSHSVIVVIVIHGHPAISLYYASRPNVIFRDVATLPLHASSSIPQTPLLARSLLKLSAMAK
jgi:hypothetical protein